jgi:hypothetical protein
MMARALVYCLLGGLPLTIAALGAGQPAWWWASGIVMAAGFVPVAIYGPRGMWRQFAVIVPALLVITVFCTWTEAMVFSPRFRQDAINNLVGAAVMYLLVAIVLALLARALSMNRPSDGGAVPHHPVLSALAAIVASGLAYAIYYWIAGSITFQFFTRDYYPDALQQVAALGGWFWPLQIGRGMLMALSVLPIVYTLRLPRWPAAIVVGALIWIAGGLAPLLIPNQFIGGTQRAIHVVEILFQNAPLGITLVLLCRERRAGGARLSKGLRRTDAIRAG